jgi:arylsulfatase A-like enzyme
MESTYSHVTRSIDVLPTLLGLSGLSTDSYAGEGVNLAPTLAGEGAPPELAAFSHLQIMDVAHVEKMKANSLDTVSSLFPAEDLNWMWVSVRIGDLVYKLERRELGPLERAVYDWSTDSTESRNLYEPESTAHAAAFERLESYRQAFIQSYREARADLDGLPTEERLEMLRAMGYVH